MGAQPSLYEVLGVPPDATAEQIRHAYRLAARRTHPDAGGRAPAFARVAVAYRVLGDPQLRRRYDQQISGTARQAAAGAYPSNGPSTSWPPHTGAQQSASPPQAGGDSGAGTGTPADRGPHPLAPGADPVVRRRYFILMGIALTLFILGGAVVRLYSLPAAMIMMVVAAIIPPIAVTVASRPRRPTPPDDHHPSGGQPDPQ